MAFARVFLALCKRMKLPLLFSTEINKFANHYYHKSPLDKIEPLINFNWAKFDMVNFGQPIGEKIGEISRGIKISFPSTRLESQLIRNYIIFWTYRFSLSALRCVQSRFILSGDLDDTMQT